MNKYGFLLVVLIAVLFGAYWFQQNVDEPLGDFIVPGDPVVRIGDYTLRVDVADTSEKRKQGLSGRQDMGDIDGMLFIFDEPAYHGIWMRNMNFDIDVIWIDKDLKIIGITTNLKPGSYPEIYEPPSPALYAIETETRVASLIGIRVGQTIELPAGYRGERQ